MAAIITAALPAAPEAAPVRAAAAVRPSEGYWLVAADGGAFSFGAARFYGPNRNEGPDIVASARTADGGGYWMVDDDGDVFAYGNAVNHGSRVYNANDVVGLAARPQGDGYWIASTGGGIFAFGGAAFFGSTGGLRLNKPIVGVAATPSGNGYWLVASDGGIFSFGDAAFFGSTGGLRLNKPIVGIAATPSGNGYWLVASDGGIFSFGDAAFFGSTGAIRLNRPITAITSTGTGLGYWLVASDGGIFSFGDAAFFGSTGALPLTQPIVTMMGAPPGEAQPAPPVVNPPNPDDDPPVDQQPATARPVAVADQAAVDEDGSVVVDVLDNDSELDDGGLVVAIVGGPAEGTATVTPANRVVYSPNDDYAGSDQFTYRVTDVQGDAAAAVVTVTVRARNDAPVIGAIDGQAIDEDGTTGPVPFTVTDPDRSPPVVTITATSSNPTLVPGANISIGGAGSDRTVTVTPESDANGFATIAVTVTDGAGATDSTFFNVTVNPTDDQPVAADDGADTAEDEAVVINVAANDADPDGGGLTVAVDNATLDATIEGTAVVNGTRITFTPAPDTNGVSVFGYTITDADGDVSPATVTVSVSAVNDAPTIDAIGDVTVNLGDIVPAVFITVADPDHTADELTVSVGSSNPDLVAATGLNLTGTGSPWTLLIVPLPGIAGATTITVTVTDPAGGTALQLFLLTVVVV